MFHNCKAVVALSKEPNDTVFQKTLGINDFYFAGGDYEWPLGNIQMIGKSNAVAMRGEKPKLTKLAPSGPSLKSPEHAVDFWLTTEDLPLPENRVTSDSDGNVHLAYTMTNDAEADGLYGELKKIFNHIGMAEHHVLGKNFYMDMGIPVAGCAHQAGHLPLRRRPGHLGARCQLQGARARQPVRRRYQLLPEHRRGEPGAYGHGQRDPCRRAPAEQDGLTGKADTHELVPTDCRLRLPVQLRAELPGGAGWGGGVAVPAAPRFPERVRRAAGPDGGPVPVRSP